MPPSRSISMVEQISSTKSTRLPIEIWTDLQRAYGTLLTSSSMQDRKTNSDHISIELQETRFNLFSRLSGRTWFPVKLAGSVSVEDDSDAVQNEDMTIGPEDSSGRPPPISTAPCFSIWTSRDKLGDADRSAGISILNRCVFKLELLERYLQGLLSSEVTLQRDARSTSKRIPVEQQRLCRWIDQRRGIHVSQLQSSEGELFGLFELDLGVSRPFLSMEEPSLEQSRVAIALIRGS